MLAGNHHRIPVSYTHLDVYKRQDENNEQTVLDGCDVPTPFEHKVIERIGTAIGQVDAIVQNRRQLSETAETAFEDGITANMCDAFLKMRPVSDADKVTTTIQMCIRDSFSSA